MSSTPVPVVAPSIISLGISLPLLPKGYKSPSFTPLSRSSSPKISQGDHHTNPLPSTAAVTTSRLLPAGPAFQAHARRVMQQRSFEEDDRLQLEEFLANGGGAGDEEDDEDGGLGDEQEEKSLLLLDPKLWKVRLRFEGREGRRLMGCTGARSLCGSGTSGPSPQGYA